MAILNTTELCALLGVSPTAIKKAADTGRISVHSRTQSNRPLYDSEVVVTQWQESTNQAMRRAGKTGGRKRKDGSPPQPKPRRPAAGLIDKLLPPLNAEDKKAAPDLDGIRDDDGRPNLNRATAAEKYYKALQAKQDYELKSGLLVKIEDVARIVEQEYGRVRARLLGIAAKVAAEVALIDDTPKCRKLIEAAIVDALSELRADASAQNGQLKANENE